MKFDSKQNLLDALTTRYNLLVHYLQIKILLSLKMILLHKACFQNDISDIINYNVYSI